MNWVRLGIVFCWMVMVPPLVFSQGNGNGKGNGNGGGGGGGGGPEPEPCVGTEAAFVFVANDNGGVAVFGAGFGPADLVGPCHLVEIPGGNPQALTLHPTLNVLYVADRTNDQVHVFDIGSAGELAPLTSRAVEDTGIGGASDLELNPNGNVLYVSARGSLGGLAVFDVDGSGDLSNRSEHHLGEPVMRLGVAPTEDVVFLAADSPSPPCDPTKNNCKNANYDKLISVELDANGKPTGDSDEVLLSHFDLDGDGDIDDQRPRGVVANDTHVFVAAFYSNRIWRCPVDDLSESACTYDDVSSQDVLWPWGLAVDGPTLFVASYGQSSRGSRAGEGASSFDSESLALTSHVETGNARNIVIDMQHAFVADFEGSLFLLPVVNDQLTAGDTISAAGELTKELAVIPASRLDP